MITLDALRNSEGRKAQFARFILNGCLAAGIHYGLYVLLLMTINIYEDKIANRELAVNAAYSIGYIVSFIVNFYTTCYFTFRKLPTMKLFLGFSGSHCVNYLLHVVLFWVCLQLNVHELIAPIIVMGIAMLVQFTILRFVFKH